MNIMSISITFFTLEMDNLAIECPSNERNLLLLNMCVTAIIDNNGLMKY